MIGPPLQGPECVRSRAPGIRAEGTSCSHVSTANRELVAPKHQHDIARHLGSRAAASIAATALLLAAPPFSMAAQESVIQTVSPSQITQYAKSLPKQQVDKGRVWTVVVGGAAILFGATVLAENNEAWFPAISRANKAVKMSREAQKARERQQAEAARQTALVSEALVQARVARTAAQAALPSQATTSSASPTHAGPVSSSEGSAGLGPASDNIAQSHSQPVAGTADPLAATEIRPSFQPATDHEQHNLSAAGTQHDELHEAKARSAGSSSPVVTSNSQHVGVP
ncbi:hypothetical protein V8C86DRAFT_2450434 [Haematococcus lacustris]